MIRSLSRVINRVEESHTYIKLLILRCPFDAILTIINACFLGYSFESISQGSEVNLRNACLYFAIASTLLFLYNGNIWYLYARFVTRFVGKLRKMVFSSILHMPFKKFDERSSGEWMTRLNSDAQMTINLVNAPLNIPHAVVSVVNIAVSSLLLYHINTTLMFITLLFVIPHVVVNRKLVYTKIARLMEQSQEYVERNVTCFAAFITCADIVSLYDAKDFVMQAYEESSIEIVRSNLRIHRKRAINSLVIPLFGMGGYIVILLLGLVMIRWNVLTFGTLTAALQYRGAILMGTMLFINSMIEIRTNAVGLRRMEEEKFSEKSVLEKEQQFEEEVLLRIGEVAAFFNVSVKAIRIYEKKGIIKPAKVDEYTGYRYYTVEQVQQLNALVELKALGFSLDEIKKIMVGGITNEKLLGELTRKRMVWEDSISSAENKIDAINKITKRLSTSKEALKIQELTEEQRAWLLVKMVCVEDVKVQSLLSEAIWL